MNQLSFGAALAALLLVQASVAQDNILDARTNYGVGDVVTVSGVVTSDDNLGSVRYLQDATAGIALYPGADWAAWSATPAIGGMGAFATEIHGMVVRIDMDDGGLVWRADLRSAIASSPVLIGDTLVVGLVSGDVVALGPSPAD